MIYLAFNNNVTPSLVTKAHGFFKPYLDTIVDNLPTLPSLKPASSSKFKLSSVLNYCYRDSDSMGLGNRRYSVCCQSTALRKRSHRFLKVKFSRSNNSDRLWYN
jgi:hypothetical protein